MKEKTVWFGTKRGIRFEINRFESVDKTSFKYSWTFYLWLCPEQFPESIRDQISTEIYYTSYGTPIETHRGILDGLDWHGGLTWSSNESKPGMPFAQYKFGCDFQHLWDMYCDYDLKDVEAAVDKCIESLYKTWPDLKTTDQLWEEFRKKFPGNNVEFTSRFDVNANQIAE